MKCNDCKFLEYETDSLGLVVSCAKNIQIHITVILIDEPCDYGEPKGEHE